MSDKERAELYANALRLILEGTKASTPTAYDRLKAIQDITIAALTAGLS